MTYQIKRSDKEINAVLDRTVHAIEGFTKHPDLTYEQGVSLTIAWIVGDSDDNPMDE